MKVQKFQNSITGKPIFIGVSMFCFLLLLTQLLAYERYLSLEAKETRKLTIEANAAKERLQTTLTNSLSSTQTLAFIVEKYGVPNDFDSIAKKLLKSNQLIDALELLQGGVITNIYPLKGNEIALGYDILTDPERHTGALKAIENKDFFFAGPVELKQGGVAVIGRQPIFIKNKFWGFSAALIRLPNFFKAAGIDTNDNHDFSYQLSKVNSTDGSEEFFLPGQKHLLNEDFIPVEIPNSEWRLYVVLRDRSALYLNTFIFSLFGLILSLAVGVLAWYMAKQPEELSRLVVEKTSELISTENNHRATLERVSDAFVALDRNWCYTYMNYKAGEIFNRDPGKMIGKHIWTEFPEGIGQPFYKAYHQAMQDQKFIFLEEYYPPYDLWFENYIYPSSNGLSIFFRDITNIRKAKEKLAASEKYFRALIEKSSDAIVLLNAEGKVVYQSPSTEKISGYTLEEMQAVNGLDLIHPDDQQEDMLMFLKLTQEPGSTTPRNHRFRHKNGNYIWLEGTYSNLLNDENVKAIVYNYHDVTKRKEAEEQTVIEKNLSESIINSLPGVFYLYNREGDFFRWNKNFEVISGYSPEEISRMHPLDFFEGHEKRLVQLKIDTVFKEGKADVEAHFFTKGGDRLLYYFNGHIARFDGNEYLIGMGIDITQLKKTQEQLKKSNEDISLLNVHLQAIVNQLQSKNKDLQQFSYIVSHNLRAPLAKILGLASILGDDQEENKMLVEKITEETINLDNIVKDINTIVSSRHPREEKEYVLFDTELKLIEKVLSNEIAQSKAIITSDFTRVEGINTVKSYHYSIIYNLVSNAIKYRRNDIPLKIHLQTKEDQNIICFSIQDNGMGIDLVKNTDKIFGLYKRFHAGTAEGKGMGLSLVKTQTESLGGRVEVESKINEGSIFSIYLPKI